MHVYPDKVRRGLAFCVPLSGRPVPYQWALSVPGLPDPPNFYILRFHTVGKRTDIARNEMVEAAQSANCRLLYFVDDDTVPPVHGLVRLIYDLENHPEIDVVSGIYVSKQDPPAPVVFKKAGDGPFWDWTVSDTFEVEEIGLGCALIRMSVFDKLAKPYFTFEKKPVTWGGVKYNLETWEDLYFCQKLHEAGCRILVDSSVLCLHCDIGTGKVHELPKESLPWKRWRARTYPGVNLERAIQIDGWMEETELAWLGKQARAHQCIVEIGSYLGRSTRVLGDNTPGHVHAIDDWNGPRDATLSAADRAVLFDRFLVNMENLNGKVRPQRSDHAVAVLEACPAEATECLTAPHGPDMVFLDGSHEYDELKRDIETWRGRLAPGGLLCGHDYAENWPSVRQAVDECVTGAQIAPETTIWYTYV
jgi:hypothetical protein